MGVAIGVVFGALMQLFASIVGMVGVGFQYNFKIYWKNQGFRTVLKLLPTRSADQGIDYVMSILNTNLASRMGEQAIRAYQQASSLKSMPVNLIGVAISTAFFPKLSEDAAVKDNEKFINTFKKSLSSIVWISLPVAVIAFFIRGYVVNFIKNGGDPKIASVLGSFVVAIFCQSVFHIASRGFYARQNTKTPLVLSIVSFVVQLVLALIFSANGFGPEGLAYALSISALVEVALLLIIQNKEMKGRIFDKAMMSSLIRILIASAIAGIVSYIMTKILPLRAVDNSFLSTFPKFCVICMVSLVAYLGACVALRIPEVRPVMEKIRVILFKNVK